MASLRDCRTPWKPGWGRRRWKNRSPLAAPAVRSGRVRHQAPFNGEMGVRISASTEFIRYCGVCTGLVAHAGAPIEPLGGRHLAAASSAKSAGCWLTSRCVRPTWPAFSRSTLMSQLRVIHHLVDVDVGGARNLRDLLPPVAAQSGNSASASRPTTCTSMGAGRPKFRIWLVMLAASKKNVLVGKFLVQALAEPVGVNGGRAVLRS